MIHNFKISEIRSAQKQWDNIKASLKKRAIEFALADTSYTHYWLVEDSIVSKIKTGNIGSKVIFVYFLQTDEGRRWAQTHEVMIPIWMIELDETNWNLEIQKMKDKRLEADKINQQRQLAVNIRYLEKQLQQARKGMDELKEAN